MEKSKEKSKCEVEKEVEKEVVDRVVEMGWEKEEENFGMLLKQLKERQKGEKGRNQGEKG